MKILTIVGARPQFIKASVVSAALNALHQCTEVLVHTGQHFDSNMSDVFFTELGMRPPAYNLNIHGGGQGEMTGRMLTEIERVLIAEKPDAVLVYGDTNSTLAGALAAVKLHIPVSHVEAGLRSFNMRMPEEVNRILTDRVSRWLFTPTEAAAQHLQREGMNAAQIIPVGDVMFDVALHHGVRVGASRGILDQLALVSGQYILATLHRAENTEVSLRPKNAVDALERVARSMPVIWPIHPRTRKILESQDRLAKLTSNLHLIDPVGYLDMVRLEKNAAVITTDSGGVQKEAFFFGVPCVTLRDETEWVELVDAGWNQLAPPVDAEHVRSVILAAVGRKGRVIQPYGTGDSATKIAQRLYNDLNA